MVGEWVWREVGEGGLVNVTHTKEIIISSEL